MIISDLGPTQGPAELRWGAPPLGTPSRLEPPWHPSKQAGALRGRPKRRQELPKRGPERPREPQESPKRAPREPQEAPRAAQEAPREAKIAPREPQEAPKGLWERF